MNAITGTAEDRIKAALTRRFDVLATEGRCVYAREVRLLTWGHIAEGSAKSVRADFVASLDGSPLVAIEVKGLFEQPTELGKALSQADDYARAQVARAQRASDTVPREWLDRPIRFSALAAAIKVCRETIQEHADKAHRIVGCRNVGFLSLEDRGLCFRLGGERWWTEWNGWRADAFARGFRVGSQRRAPP